MYNFQLNWFGATDYCLERNWKLIVLDSAEIRKEFESFLTKYSKLYNFLIFFFSKVSDLL